MPAYNKVVYGGKTLIDLSSDTVSEDTVLEGYTGHKADGTPFVGTLKIGVPGTEFCVYHDLLDSSSDVILDSNGNNIESRIIYVTK